MMRSAFINRFRSTFLVASTSTMLHGLEPTFSPRYHRFHHKGPQPSADDNLCACGGRRDLKAANSASDTLWRSSPSSCGGSPSIFAMGTSSPLGSKGDKPPEKEKEGRGKPENLRNVMYYFETVMPLIFESRLFFLKYNPPQIYTPNVILENHMREPMRTVRGLPMLLLWQNIFRLSYTMKYMANRLVILNQWIDAEEATVTINFRILSVRKLNLQGVKPSQAEEALENVLSERAEWNDYLLILHVTNHDRVWKVVITQKTTERAPPLAARFRTPFLNIRRRVAPQQEMPLPV